MEMLVSTINIINQRLERIDVCEKLSKLDQKIDERFDKIEKCITNIYQEIENVKTTQKVHSEILDKEETHHHELPTG
jgi:ribosome assembly protein YihI (activator of Der GTPase)